MSEITLKTKEEWYQQIKEVKETRNEDLEYMLYADLRELAIRTAYTEYPKYKFTGISKSEFATCGEFAIFKVIQTYDLDKAGSVIAYLMQSVQWSIQDELIKPYYSVKNKFYREAVSLNAMVKDGASMEDVLGSQFAITEAEVYGEIQDQGGTVDVITDAFTTYSLTIKADEAKLLKTVLSVTLEMPTATEQDVNRELAKVFPDVSEPALRKRKQRALSRFADFLKNNSGICHS